MYVAPPAGPIRRPLRQPEGFAKTSLEPGESRDATVTLDARSFAHWQPADPALDELVEQVQRTLAWATAPQGRQHSGWVVRRGTYEILVGRNSRTFDHSLTIDVPASFAL